MSLSRILTTVSIIIALLITALLITRVSHAVAGVVDYVLPPPAVRTVSIPTSPQRVIIDRPTQSPSIPLSPQADPLP